MPKNYIIGNWKMNQSLDQIIHFFNETQKQISTEGNFWIAPQMIHISRCLDLSASSQIKIGAQNISHAERGAYTGETSSESLKEMGTHFTLIGHSERRSQFSENDELINLKVTKAITTGLIPVICVGESLQERESGQTLNIVLKQIEGALKDISIIDENQIILAYEPVWAIGTGKTASPEQAEEVHTAIRNFLVENYPNTGKSLSILYGGSVKPSNIKELLSMPNINGGLVGGASIEPSSFSSLCNA